MATIDLDTEHWVKVSPFGARTDTLTAVGFPCFYTNTSAPPEKASEGEEIEVASSLTLENPAGLWFIGKTAEAGEEQGASLLEITPIAPGQIEAGEIAAGAITTEKLATGAVTEPKIAEEAVANAKILPPTVPAVAAAKTVKVGVAGNRTVLANLKGDGGTTLKYKVKHSLETFNVAVTCYSNVSEKAGVQITGASMPVITAISASEVELTFGAGTPANNEVIWVKVEA